MSECVRENGDWKFAKYNKEEEEEKEKEKEKEKGWMIVDDAKKFRTLEDDDGGDEDWGRNKKKRPWG